MRFFSKSNVMSKPARRRSTSLGLEPLEGRRLLSGTGLGFDPPVLGLISAVQGGCYGIAADHTVWLHDVSGFHNLGGYASSLVASDTVAGTPEVFAVHLDNSVWLNNGVSSQSWQSLGGSAKQISANTDGKLYAVWTDNSVHEYDSRGWHTLDGGLTAKQVSASNGEVYAIGTDNKLYAHVAFTLTNDNHYFGWHQLASTASVVQISATTNGKIYVIGSDDGLYDTSFNVSTNTAGLWRSDGFQGAEISANDAEVYAIGYNNQGYVFHPGQGWSSLGMQVTAVAATQGNQADVNGLPAPIDQVYAFGLDNFTPYVDTLSKGFQKLR